ncbi:LPXTG cell wall anchor domain-containing protein [Streptomyces venezuelae]|uniref:LPXTG cell wall anchor domain-containing protein n=1 Tax=Streptomyces venezuelae TaxID=54571 RepID=UPI00123A7C29|nr:LPXTG cell wall anchor domain-containing protein [Streptomyces venezuelae]
MKLRRAMAAAAATAAIAPIALLSAPAASATEGTSTPPAPAAGAPTESATPTPSVTPPAQTPEPEKTPGKPTPPTAPPAPEKKRSDEVKVPKTPKTPEVPEVPDEDAEDEAPATCESDDGSTDPDSVLEVDFVGLPKKIVAGSGWHRFKLTAENPTDEPLGDVRWTAFVNNLGAHPDKKDGLRYFTEVQYQDPETKEWTTVESPLNDGLAYGTVELDAEDSADVKLRAKVDAKAPAVDGYVEGLGKYVDPELDCTHTSSKYSPLTIVKAGGDETAEPTPKPSPSKTAQAAPAPQGSASETPAPVDGSLAETGSSSMLPTVGVIGGIAVVAGAGVVFAVRRRKVDGTA